LLTKVLKLQKPNEHQDHYTSLILSMLRALYIEKLKSTDRILYEHWLVYNMYLNHRKSLLIPEV